MSCLTGWIKEMHFKNVTLDGGEDRGRYEIWINGHSEGYGVSDITFENVSRFEEPLSADSPMCALRAMPAELCLSKPSALMGISVPVSIDPSSQDNDYAFPPDRPPGDVGETILQFYPGGGRGWPCNFPGVDQEWHT